LSEVDEGDGTSSARQVFFIHIIIFLKVFKRSLIAKLVTFCDDKKLQEIIEVMNFHLCLN